MTDGMTPKRVLLLLAGGFETMEFSVFVDVMGWARCDFGCDITVETCGVSEREVVSTFGVPVTADRVLCEISADDYDALAIPGGFEEYGFYKEAFSPEVSALIRAFDAQKKPIASVCVAALALAHSGILAGREATTYHLQGGHRQHQLAAYGVNVRHEPIVISEHIITSGCPQTAPGVAFALLAMLCGDAKMREVRAAMGYGCDG